MKLAIMQPYIFPYIGYFQLINSVDTFVFYDDVNFINSGWVNRNKIFVNNKELLFTIPTNWSQNKKINEVLLSENYEKWKTKFFITLKHAYGKKQNFDDMLNIVKETFDKSNDLNSLCKNSILNVLNYLDVKKNIVFSSDVYKNSSLTASDRIIDICKKEKCTDYINTIGGTELYSKEHFLSENINLSFIKCKEPLKYLSIIDIIAIHGKETKLFLDKCEII